MIIVKKWQPEGITDYVGSKSLWGPDNLHIPNVLILAEVKALFNMYTRLGIKLLHLTVFTI